MKFAFCLYKYFPFGGLQRDFIRIAKESLRRGHTVDVFTMHWEGEKDPKINLHLIPKKGLQNHTQSYYFSKELSQRLKGYDIVLGFNKMPGLDVYYAADTCFVAKAKKHPFWYQWFPRYRHYAAYERAVFDKDQKTRILMLSKQQQVEFSKIYYTSSDRFHLLPPGISKDRKLPSNAENIREKIRQTFSLKPDDFLLLMIGSGFKTKGLDRILYGIASLPIQLQSRVTLLVVGQDHSQAFQGLAKKLNIKNHCHFLGGRHDVPELLLAGDLLLHPAYNENTGTVLLEACVSGLPVLTTDVCGYAEYITKANAGIVLPSPFHQSDMNDALSTMLTSKDRSMWRQNALIFAEKADIYNLPERALDYLESMTL